MKASELRIGNYVNDRFDAEVTVCDITHGGINLNYGYSTISIDELKPIPLTEEWLLRFGFDKPFKTVGDFERWQKGEFRLLNGKLLPLSNVEIQHVHQLQNLYFALTGEELEFNL
jgi:hypothetical protein